MGGQERWDVIIVGSGIAGLSVAIWARRLGLSALVLERSLATGGQLRAIAQPIVDYPGLEALPGTTLSDRLREQAEAAGAVLRPGCPVTQIDCRQRTVATADGAFAAGAIVLATGLSPRRLGVPGEAELEARGLVRRPSREPDWFCSKRVAVVGGGDRAAENALLLLEAGARVSLLVRGERPRARRAFLSQLAGVDLHTETEVTAFRFTPEAVLVDIRGRPSLTVDAVCIYIGNQPNTQLVAGQVQLTPDGYLVTDREGCASLPGIYGVGDVCTLPAFQSLATAAGQAMVVAKQIALSRT